MSNFGVTAIKTNNDDLVLDALSQFFRQKNLEIAQPAIGDSQGPYVDPTQAYPDISSFVEAVDKWAAQTRQPYSSYFDLFTDPKYPDWIFLGYPQGMAVNTMTINRELGQYLSEQLKVPVVEFSNYSVISQKIVRKFDKGFTEDELSVTDFMVMEAYGYFSNLSDETDMEVIDQKVSDYFTSIGVDPETAGYEWKTEKSHPFYLKGPLALLKTYLESGQEL